MSSLDELAQLAQLRDQGVITPDEFETQKSRLLRLSSREQPAAQAEDADLRLLVPIGRTWQSIVAGYLGLVAIIPPLSLAAVAMGAWALADLKQRPNLTGRGRAWFGIIGGTICVVLHLGLLIWRLAS